MQNLLNKIILSDSVVKDFYNEYNNNKEFKSWIDATIPEIEQCEKQQQNNPWHKYNVLGHILHSVEAINKQTINLPKNERKMLAYTMLFHDIGKPEKHITRQKGGQIIDSFFDHNIASERISRERLPELGFNKEEIEVIAKLVNKHDIFMFIKAYKTNNPYWRVLSKDLVEEEIKNLNSAGNGQKLMRWLVMVGRADNLAQNEKMTAESLELLDRFDTILNELEEIKTI